MTTLFITDAWGQHSSWAPVIDQLTQAFGPVQCIDPYAGQPFVFESDDQAENYFACRCSGDSYQQLVAQALTEADAPVTALAVGAGADALAALLDSPLADKLAQVFLVDRETVSPVTHPSARHYPRNSDAKRGFFNPRAKHFDAALQAKVLAGLVK